MASPFLTLLVLVGLAIIFAILRKRSKLWVEIPLAVVGCAVVGGLITIFADGSRMIRGGGEAFATFIFSTLALGGLYLLVRRNRRVEDPPPKKKDVPPVPPEPPVPRPAGPAIFISYRRQDSSDVTGRIYDRLVETFGRDRIFKDVDSIPLGVDFRKHLASSVGQCHIFLAVIGRSWLTPDPTRKESPLQDARDFVRIEIEAALQREIPIIPVLVQGANVPAEESLPPTLQPLAFHNGISVRPDPDFHPDMGRLIHGIEQHLAGKT